MIPKVETDLVNLEIKRQPSRTYALNKTTGRVRGMVDEGEALSQAIYKILNTERYKYLIYSWNYGVEFADLIGKPKDYAMAEIKRFIIEALTQDDRITAVDSFTFSTTKKAVHVTFTAHTIYGEITMEVDLDV